MTPILSQIGEFGLIDQIKKTIPSSSSVLLGIGDDAAVVTSSPNKKILLTTDMLIEGVHFTQEATPFWIGRKALAVNISDIAAMGGLPRYALLSLGLPPHKKNSYVKDLYKGFRSIAQEFNIDIVGGDIVKSGQVIINVALTGEAARSHWVKRSSAVIGNKIFVTGPLGNSYGSGHHLRFTPRVKESQYLVKNFMPTSMIDVSDGLAVDLAHVLKGSHVSAVLYEDKIPLRKGAKLKDALSDGEDFELLFTVTKSKARKLLLASSGFSFYEIGEIIDRKIKPMIVLRDGKKIPLALKGYAHF